MSGSVKTSAFVSTQSERDRRVRNVIHSLAEPSLEAHRTVLPALFSSTITARCIEREALQQVLPVKTVAATAVACENGSVDLIHRQRSHMDYETERRQCVIIGGGIAGLAAAAELESAGLDFILLEAGGYFTTECVTFELRGIISSIAPTTCVENGTRKSSLPSYQWSVC